jgi:hypothetical protein
MQQHEVSLFLPLVYEGKDSAVAKTELKRFEQRIAFAKAPFTKRDEETTTRQKPSAARACDAAGDNESGDLTQAYFVYSFPASSRLRIALATCTSHKGPR